ncbi:hybrid sensor histidine kinase/response regulator [Halothiobacillus diazotrophicus]|uniref:histidine kinase n=1 Tax=Halothiobacillus diazotrophicus TaxID=1860122 RepID=A0A191ZFX9_9GAMM|nr:ATP-binding protein [Halothiobacillus diazotrophicus]ANJ66786.1 hybrid sensor histidine kinase/response regulator [Halothiobacillus diazotrophicus]
MKKLRRLPRLDTNPPRQVKKIRRDYKSWVANETLEDYALRYAAQDFRKWSVFRVANTAFGAVSFLALEAIGAALTVQYGFINTFWACLAASILVFLTGLPIAHYGAKYNLDMDLLTRGAGFGYIGSTITSLIYASFTFIFFAIEAAIMAQALNLYLGVPMTPSYLFSALIVLPLVGYGITVISRLQMWTQPLWLLFLVLPYLCILWKDPEAFHRLMSFGGNLGVSEFNLLAFGASTSVVLALIAQIGEQADYLRFMPQKTEANKRAWHLGILISGPGWITVGMVKLLAGGLLAYLALSSGISSAQAVQPAVLYELGFGYVFDSPVAVILAATLFVVISQIKINVTNAYAGSLAWSNFFARLTHSHPGRVIWLIFNVLIALMLMEVGVFEALGDVLGIYSNIAIGWVGAIVADLIINKPLGLSPPGIEFKRAHLYDINPVGIGALLIASTLSIIAYTGVFGPLAQAFSAFIALGTAFVVAPLIAWLTKGRYYIAREPEPTGKKQTQRCVVCEKDYETNDMALCPAYRGAICSLCCTLDARCHDMCRPGAGLQEQFIALLNYLLPRNLAARINTRLGYYLLLMLVVAGVLSTVLSLIYWQQTHHLSATDALLFEGLLVKLFVALMVLAAVGGWWLVLTVESRYVAQDESNRQTHLLMNEIEAHRKTDAQLQKAIEEAERANQAKSRYLAGISHELRTPLNSILGYAQIVEHDPAVPRQRRDEMKVIRRSGEHLVSLINGLLDIAKIEAGKLTIEPEEVDFPQFVTQLADMFRLQASEKHIRFNFEIMDELPTVVRVDKKRLGQVLINILGNAIKFTNEGHVTFRISYRSETVRFEIEDTGIGISEADRKRIFLPFERGSNATGQAASAGLGLTIASMLATLMGGELTVHARPGGGSRFQLRLLLTAVRNPRPLPAEAPSDILGYREPKRRILIVDDQQIDREFLHSVLAAIGFEVLQADSGITALRMAAEHQPDMIILDINMTGIDGWETARLLRTNGISEAPILIVSADVLDRGKPNTAGIAAEDFIDKPVDIGVLLQRIRDKLQLEWITNGQESADPASPATVTQTVNQNIAPDESLAPIQTIRPPSTDESDAIPTADEESLEDLPSVQVIRALHELGALGYIRGILDKLDELEHARPDLATLVRDLRVPVQQFQLGEYLRQLKELEARHERTQT